MTPEIAVLCLTVFSSQQLVCSAALVDAGIAQVLVSEGLDEFSDGVRIVHAEPGKTSPVFITNRNPRWLEALAATGSLER